MADDPFAHLTPLLTQGYELRYREKYFYRSFDRAEFGSNIIRVMEFRWNTANVEHIGKHHIEPEDAEFVVRRARRPYPEKRENDKLYVAGPTASGEYIQVVFIVDPPPLVYVIHARRLNEREKRIYRRRTR